MNLDGNRTYSNACGKNPYQLHANTLKEPPVLTSSQQYISPTPHDADFSLCGRLYMDNTRGVHTNRATKDIFTAFQLSHGQKNKTLRQENRLPVNTEVGTVE